MNRDDLLKRCVDRRVAHETSVVAVSHLFYVYLLSALKKGQQVEVPNFGTFGTRMVGVKRQRRMPFFEVERELADLVNERYRNLKTLLVGKYDLIPAETEAEYTGREPKYDSLVESMGKEVVLDTEREISVDVFQREVILQPEMIRETLQRNAPSEEPVHEGPVGKEVTHEEEPLGESEAAISMKEKKLMPKLKLNLRGEGMDDETQPVGPAPEEAPPPPPTLRDISGGEGPSPLLQIALGLLILGAITFALNHFGVIHLWGKKSPAQAIEETLPPVVQPPQQETSTPTAAESLAQKGEATPTPTPTTGIEETKPPTTEKKEETVKPPVAETKEEVKPTPTKIDVSTAPPSGTGNYTVQISSWPTQADANRVVGRLSGSGFDAYIAEGFVKGKKWYRVRVGRYESSSAAQGAAARLKSVNENGVWVTKVD
jgi:cell division protein FtsN